jgi:hypothetical protein
MDSGGLSAVVAKRVKDTLGGRFAAPRPTEGLGSSFERLPWLGLPLGERQERALLGAGIKLVDWESEGDISKGWVLIREDVAVTAEAVQLILEEGRERGADISWRSSGRMGGLAEEIFLGTDEPLMVYLAPGRSVSFERIQEAASVELDPKERVVPFDVPRAQFGVDILEIPLADRLVLPAGHWNQLLWANLLALGPFLWRELAGRHLHQVIWRLLWAVLRARSLYLPHWAAKLGRKGKDCIIHPTAVVEGCWLGDGVQIGAHAVVRGCVLADGVTIEPLSMVEASVLAAGARVQRQALVKYSVLSERASVAGSIQLSVLGVEATVKHSALLLDQALGSQGVRVQVGGRLEPAPLGLAGCCVGDRTFIGAQVAVAPGRALPADLRIIPAPESVLSQITEGVEGICTVRDGRLESV